MKRRFASSRGVTKLTLLVFGAVVFAVGYTGYRVLPFYYCYYEIQNQFEQIIRVADTVSDKEIRTRLWDQIVYLDIPVGKEDLLIERAGHHMKIRLAYEERFDVRVPRWVLFWEKDEAPAESPIPGLPTVKHTKPYREYLIRKFPFVAQAEGDF